MVQEAGSGGGGDSQPSTVVDVDQRQYTLTQFGTPPDVPNAPTQQQTITAVSQSGLFQQDVQIGPAQFDANRQYTLTAQSQGGLTNQDYTFTAHGQTPPQDIEYVQGQGSQYGGREYYQGGGEQAYMGPIYQAQAAFGFLSDEEIDFLGVNTNLPSHLNPAQERILLDSGVPVSVLEELYDYDPDTAFWFRTDYDNLGGMDLSGGYPSYSYGNTGMGRYSYPSGGGRYTTGGGLINWRIGI